MFEDVYVQLSNSLWHCSLELTFPKNSKSCFQVLRNWWNAHSKSNKIDLITFTFFQILWNPLIVLVCWSKIVTRANFLSLFVTTSYLFVIILSPFWYLFVTVCTTNYLFVIILSTFFIFLSPFVTILLPFCLACSRVYCCRSIAQWIRPTPK